MPHELRNYTRCDVARIREPRHECGRNGSIEPLVQDSLRGANPGRVALTRAIAISRERIDTPLRNQPIDRLVHELARDCRSVGVVRQLRAIALPDGYCDLGHRILGPRRGIPVPPQGTNQERHDCCSRDPGYAGRA
jgi:hypothetical protein